METRRDTLKIIGAIGTTCAFPFAADELYGQHVHEASKRAPEPAGPYQPKFFSAGEMATVARIADLIIPPTDTPGAVGAGVPAYIDSVVAANTEHQQHYRDGLALMDGRRNGKKFVELSEAEQIAILTPLSEAVDRGDAKSREERFFSLIKSMTADGYYTSQVGLVQELGYKGNTALAAFPACVHEH